MFLRTKTVAGHRYLMLVNNYRQNGKVKQRVIKSFGRQDQVNLHEVMRYWSRMAGREFLREGLPPESLALRGAKVGAASPPERTLVDARMSPVG